MPGFGAVASRCALHTCTFSMHSFISQHWLEVSSPCVCQAPFWLGCHSDLESKDCTCTAYSQDLVPYQPQSTGA